jgi:hypothetical protein
MSDKRSVKIKKKTPQATKKPVKKSKSVKQQQYNIKVESDRFLLNEAIGLWWGLQDMGTWSFTKNKPNKNINYTNEPEDSLECFKNFNSPESCKKMKKCKLTQSEKCVPSEAVSEYPKIGSKINSKTDGEVFTVTHFFKFINTNATYDKRNPDGHEIVINVLENKDRAVVLFPISQRLDYDQLIQLIPNESKIELIEKIESLIKSKNLVVLCGHSMGCVLAQIFGLELIIRGLAKENVFVVGSGAFMWASKPIVDMFQTVFSNRFQFFGYKRGEGDAKRKNEIDNFLLSTDMDNSTYFHTTLLERNKKQSEDEWEDEGINEIIASDLNTESVNAHKAYVKIKEEMGYYGADTQLHEYHKYVQPIYIYCTGIKKGNVYRIEQ